jgi:hypothetical protein
MRLRWERSRVWNDDFYALAGAAGDPCVTALAASPFTAARVIQMALLATTERI